MRFPIERGRDTIGNTDGDAKTGYALITSKVPSVLSRVCLCRGPRQMCAMSDELFQVIYRTHQLTEFYKC